MKVALYVCRTGEGWSMMLSLDIRVDVAWWLEGGSGRHVLRWLLLDQALPLSQASWLVEHFEMERSMDQWGQREWQSYLARKLDVYELASGEVEARKGVAGKAGSVAARRIQVGGMPPSYPAEQWAQLERDAALLAERISGRQLLAAEAEALLGDTAQPPTEWRAAAQLARLQGRLSITAALQGPTTRRRHAWLGRARSAPRCHRCGSEARQRVPCAACGLAACAYCEACLALGRSRACALLLRSAAQGAVPVRGEAPRGTAMAPTGGGLARWGLSAAQSAAAAALCARIFGQIARRGWAGAVLAVGSDRGRQDRDDFPTAPTYIGSRWTSAGRYAAQGCGAGIGSASGQCLSRHIARYPLRRQ